MTEQTDPIDTSFISTLDDACTQIYDAMRDVEPVHEVHVAPALYDAVVEAKRTQHLSRGNPLLLLALDLVRDEDLAPGTASVR
jgi:hypothetical protein